VSATLRFFLVDAFAEQPFRGNPAGVVLDADALADAQMQAIAREVNASETAFVSRTRDLHRPPHLRWFTPAGEVEFCGHATLAAAHALVEAGWAGAAAETGGSQVMFSSAAGELALTGEELPEPHRQRLWWLQMPRPELQPDHTNPIRTTELLGVPLDALDDGLPPMRTRDADLILFVKTWQTLVEAQPRFDELAEWCRRSALRGILLATTHTLSDAVDVQSRFFAPACGVNEDPVTGSAHGPLAAYLAASGLVGHAKGRSALLCLQGRPGDRTGLVRAIATAGPGGYAVRIGGVCHTTIRGEVAAPPR
jgi:trans-2,3-dihydro-3-hydroxyanthranilate isomerase